jgi:hypothetical protein
VLAVIGPDHLQLTRRGMMMELGIDRTVDDPSLETGVRIAKGYRGCHDSTVIFSRTVKGTEPCLVLGLRRLRSASAGIPDRPTAASPIIALSSDNRHLLSQRKAANPVKRFKHRFRFQHSLYLSRNIPLNITNCKLPILLVLPPV